MSCTIASSLVKTENRVKRKVEDFQLILSESEQRGTSGNVKKCSVLLRGINSSLSYKAVRKNHQDHSVMGLVWKNSQEKAELIKHEHIHTAGITIFINYIFKVWICYLVHLDLVEQTSP